MKKTLAMLAFALSLSMQAQTNKTLDNSSMTVFYEYTMRTQDENGQNVTDSLRLALLVGTHATYCTTVLSYSHDGRASQEMMNAFMMHHQNVLTDVANKEVICIEPIYPDRYETHETLAEIKWELTNDTMSIADVLCHRAIGDLYGKRWTAWYAESIPTSAGPWKLRGLPGLIVKAEDAEGIHCFSLYETKNEEKKIEYVVHPDYLKVSRKQLMSFKKKTYGNARYPKEPTYYVAKGADELAEVNMNGVWFYVGNGMLVPNKGRVYQPLELK